VKYEIIRNYKEADFKNITGVTPATFHVMLEVVKVAYEETHKNRKK